MSRRGNRRGAIAALVAAVAAAPLASADDAHPVDPTTSFLARITIEVPVFTRHYPHDEEFNDHNWGAFVELGLAHHLALLGGDFINSYNRNTAVAGASWMPLELDASRVRFRAGVLVGFDLNGGYARYNQVDPLLAALSIRIEGENFHDALGALDHVGMAITILPPAPTGGAVAVNLALTVRL